MKHKYPKEKRIFSKVYFIYNKRASSNHKPSRFVKFLSDVIPQNESIKLYVVPDEAMEDIEVDSETLLIIFGGDGTIHKTITHLYTKKGIKEPLLIGHLRGGTMNTIATCLEIPKNSELIEKLRNREVDSVPRNSIRIKADNEELYGFMFGGSKLVYSFLKDYYGGKILGPPGAVKTILTTIVKALKGDKRVIGRHRLRIKIWDSEKQIEDNFLIFGAGTVHSFGLNFSNFPKAPLAKNSFNFVAYAGNPVKLIAFLPLIYFGILPHNAVNELTTKVTIESLDGEEVEFTLDGDLYKAKTFTLTPGPELYFIV